VSHTLLCSKTPSLTSLSFLALFTIVTAIQILLTVYWRNWYTFATLCLGGLTEVLGWLGRYLSRTNTYWNINNGGGWYFEKSWFIMQ